MAEFYSARGWEIPPLPWTNLSPPFSLKQYWRGIPSEIIGENLDPKATAVEVDVMVASERERIENDALDGIIKRAKAGELDAVTWLDERGFIDLPRQ